MLPKLGIIAGSGKLPSELINICKSIQRPYFVIAIEHNTNKDILLDVPHYWVSLGAAGKIVEQLKKEEVKQIVMAGGVRRPSWTEINPDWKGVKILPKLLASSQGDGAILALIIKELEKEGFTVVGVDDVLMDILTREGPLGEFLPDKSAKLDITRAIEVGLAMTDLDVGQAIVVQQGIVLGVEAIEGTDALIDRCSDLKRDGPGGILLKLKSKQQDSRVDLPTIGPDTIKRAGRAGIRGVALEAESSLTVDTPETIRTANQEKLFLIGIRIQRD